MQDGADEEVVFGFQEGGKAVGDAGHLFGGERRWMA
jgi:hypothetical protein